MVFLVNVLISGEHYENIIRSVIDLIIFACEMV